MNVQKSMLTPYYVKWVIDTYKGQNRICIASDGTISLEYSYKKKSYILSSFDEYSIYKNRLTAINAYKELEYSLKKTT